MRTTYSAEEVAATMDEIGRHDLANTVRRSGYKEFGRESYVTFTTFRERLEKRLARFGYYWKIEWAPVRMMRHPRLGPPKSWPAAEWFEGVMG